MVYANSLLLYCYWKFTKIRIVDNIYVYCIIITFERILKIKYIFSNNNDYSIKMISDFNI